MAKKEAPAELTAEFKKTLEKTKLINRALYTSHHWWRIRNMDLFRKPN